LVHYEEIEFIEDISDTINLHLAKLSAKPVMMRVLLELVQIIESKLRFKKLLSAFFILANGQTSQPKQLSSRREDRKQLQFAKLNIFHNLA
jgi:hypothetical protein